MRLNYNILAVGCFVTVFCQVEMDRCACHVSICTTYVTSVYGVQLVDSVRPYVEGSMKEHSCRCAPLCGEVNGDRNGVWSIVMFCLRRFYTLVRLRGFLCLYLTWVLWLCVCTDPTCLLYELLAQVRGHLSADIE